MVSLFPFLSSLFALPIFSLFPFPFSLVLQTFSLEQKADSSMLIHFVKMCGRPRDSSVLAVKS